jgi:hypothetical protein
MLSQAKIVFEFVLIPLMPLTIYAFMCILHRDLRETLYEVFFVESRVNERYMCSHLMGAPMRNITQFAVSVVLLASQVHIPSLGNVTAAAESSTPAVGVYEVKLNTNTASAVEILASKPNYDSEVLAPLHAAEAVAYAKAHASKPMVAKVTVPRVTTVVAGSHADWMRAAGISESDFGYVDYIVSHESGWVYTKSNYAGSGAYGLGQAYPAGKMAAFGSDYLTNPVTQLKWANAYAVGKYGSWANAYAHWLSNHSW